MKNLVISEQSDSFFSQIQSIHFRQLVPELWVLCEGKKLHFDKVNILFIFYLHLLSIIFNRIV